jgi:hypothetical protein
MESMLRSIPRHALGFVAAAILGACGSSAAPAKPASVAAYSLVGSWQGKGDRTLGDVNSEGRFRVRWETRDEDPTGGGRFRLTIRSGISGRTLQIAADHKGEGTGVVDFEDSPRTYDFLVESANINWSFTVEDVIPVRPGRP